MRSVDDPDTMGRNVLCFYTDICYLLILFEKELDSLGVILWGRAERRRTEKLKRKEKTATYQMTKAQLNLAVQEQIGDDLKRMKQEATDEAVNTAMILMLTLPLEVLMDYYWPKSYAKRIPEFTSHVLEYYERWQNGELDMDKLREDLWVYGGIKLIEGEG